VTGADVARARRVLVCDPHPISRAGLVTLLTQGSSIHVVGEAARPQQVANAVKCLSPQVLLVNHDSKDMDAVVLAETLNEGTPATIPAILALTGMDTENLNPGFSLRALKAGITGLIPNDSSPRSLITTVHDVFEGALVLKIAPAVKVVRRLVERLPEAGVRSLGGLEALTRRELDVLLLVANGLSNRKIAEDLSLTESTIKSHLYRLSRKLGLRDRTQAAILAYESGLVRPPVD
jgi:DNA-binding NarL/FixJ family response regulator